MTTKQAQYAADRQDPRWQKKRLEIMQRDGFKCACCEIGSVTLNVHHSYYASKRKIWDYPDWSLVTYCRDCHELSHNEEMGLEQNIKPWEVMAGWIFGDSHPDSSIALWEVSAEIEQMSRVFGRDEAMQMIKAFIRNILSK